MPLAFVVIFPQSAECEHALDVENVGAEEQALVQHRVQLQFIGWICSACCRCDQLLESRAE